MKMNTPLWILLIIAFATGGWAFGYEFGWRMYREQQKINEQSSDRPLIFNDKVPFSVLDDMLDHE